MCRKREWHPENHSGPNCYTKKQVARNSFFFRKARNYFFFPRVNCEQRKKGSESTILVKDEQPIKTRTQHCAFLRHSAHNSAHDQRNETSFYGPQLRAKRGKAITKLRVLTTISEQIVIPTSRKFHFECMIDENSLNTRGARPTHSMARSNYGRHSLGWWGSTSPTRTLGDHCVSSRKICAEHKRSI